MIWCFMWWFIQIWTLLKFSGLFALRCESSKRSTTICTWSQSAVCLPPPSLHLGETAREEEEEEEEEVVGGPVSPCMSHHSCSTTLQATAALTLDPPISTCPWVRSGPTASLHNVMFTPTLLFSQVRSTQTLDCLVFNLSRKKTHFNQCNLNQQQEFDKISIRTRILQWLIWHFMPKSFTKRSIPTLNMQPGDS